MRNLRKTKAQLLRELEALRRINHAIGTTLNLDDVLQRIIEEIVPLFAAQSASVILFDAGKREAELTTTYGKKAFQDSVLRYPWAGTFSGWIAEHCRPLRVPCITPEAWPGSWKLAKQLGGVPEQTSALLAPLWRESKVIGCLEIVWHPPHIITDSEEDLLVETATQAAIAIVNARLYQEKEHALQRAKESEERFRRIVETAQEGIWVLDAEAKTTYVNQRAAEMLGYSVHEMLGCPLFAFMDEQAQEEAAGYLERRKRGIQEKHDFRFCKRDGEYLWAIVSASPMIDEHGKFIGVFGMLTDITERKRAEEALRESERQYRDLVENSEGLICTHALDGTLLSINPAAARALGYRPENMVGHNLSEFLAPAVRQQFGRYLERVQREASMQGLLRLVSRTGEERILAYHNTLREEPNRAPYILGHAQDITERKRAEEALRASEERYRIVSQSISDYAFSFRIEEDGTVFLEWLTESFTKITGYAIEEFLGKPNPWNKYIHPDDLERINKTIRTLSPGVATSYEFRIVRRDGSVRWIHSYAQPMFDERGHLSRICGAARDITEHKRAEEQQQKLQAQILQTQKLEAIGTLAGGIAHDFNNILSAILGYADLVTDDVPIGTVARRNLEEILRASRRAKDLVQQLLAFSRPKQEKRQPIHLHEIIEETLTLLRPSLPRTIVIQQTFNAGDETVLANLTQIQQVVMNLCVNAAHAMGRKGGVLGITLERVEEGGPAELAADQLNRRPYLCLTISDTGCGMTPDILERIFEPFFTTKPVGQGSGMGLAIVHGIVKSHGGMITVDSQPGKGTTFRIYWPLIAGEEAAAASGGTFPQ